MKKLTRILLVCSVAASFLGFLPQNTQAGTNPWNYGIFMPVKTQSELNALKPNTKIAITCPDCGMVVVTKVNKDKSNLRHFECSVCKHSFELTPVAGGKAHLAQLLCKDSKGHTMPLHLCAEMHQK
jgi:predicted RNA-binding Zn-ribbon protein involved in translation (DUF1610 family)